MLYIDPKMRKSKSPIKMDVCCFCFPKMQKMVTKKWSEHFTGSPMLRMAIRWLQQDLRRSNGANNSKQRIMSSGMKQLTCVKVRSKHWIVGKLNGKNKLETKPKLVKNIYKESAQFAYWKPRSKGKYTTFEDTNTKWFYRIAKSR